MDVWNLNAKIAILEGELNLTKGVIIGESIALIVTVGYIVAHALGWVK